MANRYDDQYGGPGGGPKYRLDKQRFDEVAPAPVSVAGAQDAVAPQASGKRKYVSLTRDIARQKKLADVLSRMGAEEGSASTVGGITAPMSALGPLVRGLTSFGGSYLSGKAEGDMDAATDEEQAAVDARIAEIFYEPTKVEKPKVEKAVYEFKPDNGGVSRLTASGFDSPTDVEVAPLIDLPTLSPRDQIAALTQLASRSDIGKEAAGLYMPGVLSDLERADAKALADRPIYRPRTEYGGDLVDPTTQAVIESFPSNAKIGVPGHMTLGKYVYAINPDGTPGALLGPAPDSSGTNVTVKMPPGLNKVDEALGSMYAEWITGDTAAGEKNMTQLGMAINYMVQNPNMSGGFSGILPIEIRSLFPNLKPEANTQQMMQEVVQTNLRKVLGAQFTAREGEGLMKRIYDPQQPTSVNVDRAIRLLKSVQEAAQAKDDAMRYFGRNNTISGYKPNFAMVRSLDEIIYNAGLSGVDVSGNAPQTPKPGVDYGNPLLTGTD